MGPLLEQVDQPEKLSPDPIGISTGTAFAVRRDLMSAKTPSKSACSLSIMDTKRIRGIPRSSQYSHTFSVPTSTPEVAPRTITAASAARTAASASPVKSRYPGVSKRLIL